MHRSNRAPTVFLALLGILAVAACGQGTATAAPGVTTSPGGNPATSAPDATTGSTTGKAACDLLSAGDIREITGLVVAGTNPEPVDTVYQNVCRWTFQEGTTSLDLGILGVDARASFDRLVEFEGGTEIAGLGDRAVRTEITGSILALTGDTMVDLFLIAPGIADDVEQRLVERVLENLGR